MKNMKKWSLLLMTMTLMFIVMGLTGCGGQKKYTVTVKDALGNPYAGAVVKFMQNGEQAAMQVCDENGVAEKKLAKGEYTLEITSTDSSVEFYYEEGLTVSASKNEIEVIVAYKVSSESRTLTVDSKEYDSYAVSEGCTYVDLTTDDRSYFLFTPTKAGEYQFTVVDNENTQIGYYGTPYFVQSNSAAEVVDNAFTISVRADMISTGETGTTVCVIGIDALDEKTTNCTLAIERLGDVKKTVEDEEWTYYETTATLSAYTLPEGAQIKEFDLTASTDTYNLVYNEEDGYYHLDSTTGPLVLVRLAEDCDYIDCFQTMLDRSDVVKYFFDDDGEFIKKEKYTDCLLEYIECVDENEGVYPLTEDLKYIIQQRGDYAGWWDIEGSSYLFKDIDGNNDASINVDIAWLLMCCYIE